MNKKKKRILIGSAVVLALLLIVGGIVAYTFYHRLQSSFLKGNARQFVYIDSDDNIDSVYSKLRPVATDEALDAFQMLASHYDYASAIRTGRYAIDPGLSTLDVFRRIRGGQQSPVRLVVPSLRTIDRMAGAISRHIMLDSATIAMAFTDESFLQQLGYDTSTVYCLFVPNTYEVYWNMSLDQLAARLKREHDAYWNDDRKKLAEAIGLTPNEVVTLASIIDEETANDGEKPTIAGLYLNRLRKGMRLEADPTVKFALGDFTLKRIYNFHLDVESPYNTYRNDGLMPGPIRVPSLQGIEAVLHAEQHPYLFMCAKADFSGTHNFAVTLTEHEKNRRDFQRAQNQRGIR